MPHTMKESHLEDICCNCKHQGQKEIEIMHHHHKTYFVITCSNCGYKAIKAKDQSMKVDILKVAIHDLKFK